MLPFYRYTKIDIFRGASKSSQCLSLCATCLDSEPLHFASKSVEILRASLYRWSLENKLTLDLSRYIWKSLVGDTSCCNFFPHWLLYLNFQKCGNCDEIHLNLVEFTDDAFFVEKT